MADGAKKKVINRLKSMYPLRAKVNETYLKSVEAMSAGKRTVWAMLNFYYGDPIIKAMDLEVVYPENYGAVMAAMGVAQSYLERADAEGFPTHLCGYSRASLGYTSRMMKELKGEIPPEAPLGGIPKPIFLMASTAVCDARYKWFQALGRYMDVPVWTFEAPIPGVKELFMEGSYEGWNFVVESFGYHPPVPLDLSGCSNALERLTRFSLQVYVAYYKDALEQNVPAGSFAYPYLKYAREWKCDGAFLHPLISCRSASTHLPYVSSLLMERLKVPSLTIEGDIVDLRLFDPEDAISKAEPFEETMEYYRNIRRQEGLDW